MKLASRHAGLCRTLAAGAFVTALSMASASAQIVFDPNNYAQNVLTAARALQQINNQVTSLANEAQMLLNQAKHLANLPTSVLSRIEDNFAQMKRLMAEADKLAYSVEDIERRFTASYRDFASGKTSTQLAASARERWQQSLSAYEHALKAGAVAVGNIDGTRTETSTMVAASQSAAGALQAAQAGNQLLAVQARQMADLTALLAAQGRAEALEKSRQAAAQEQARAQLGRFLSGTGYTASTVRMFHD